MPMFAALDVSKKETQVHVVDVSGKCVWRGKVPTSPRDIATVLHPYTKQLEKVGLETGSWSSWLFHGLTEQGFKVACMDARQAHAALSVTMNKTDANDAEGLAHLLRTGLFREVRVKPWKDLRRRALLRARATLVRTVIDLGNAIRGALRLFGFNMAAGPGSGGARAFERRVETHLSDQPELAPIVLPLLEAWRAARKQARFDRCHGQKVAPFKAAEQSFARFTRSRIADGHPFVIGAHCGLFAVIPIAFCFGVVVFRAAFPAIICALMIIPYGDHRHLRGDGLQRRIHTILRVACSIISQVYNFMAGFMKTAAFCHFSIAIIIGAILVKVVA